jgi:hypothetical protein
MRLQCVRATLREHMLSRRVASNSLRKALRLMSDRDRFMLPFLRRPKTLIGARFTARSVMRFCGEPRAATLVSPQKDA